MSKFENSRRIEERKKLALAASEFSQSTESEDPTITKLVDFVSDLKKKNKFLNALKEFIDHLPSDIGPNMLEYKKVMEEELRKDPKDVQSSRIEQATDKFLNREHMKVISWNFVLKQKIKKREITGYRLEIEYNFPDEMKQFVEILKILDNVKINQEFYSALEAIIRQLDLNYDKVKLFYEAKEIKVEKKEEKILLPHDSDKFDLPEMIKSPVSDSLGVDELIRNKHFGMEASDFDRKFELITSKYVLWKDIHASAINSWAKSKKGKLGTSEEDICETIAVMDRAFNLTTGGYRLHTTQILAVLRFFDHTEKGFICEIQAGEGKTVIASLLAVVKALQGHKVDIITSSGELASDGVNQTKTFYSVFGVTVATNNPGEEPDYTADVIYGNIDNFQTDFLKDECKGMNIRQNRPFQQLILDEVDSLFVDNDRHVAKLALPSRGMECLKYIYIHIWVKLQQAENTVLTDTSKQLDSITGKNEIRQFISTKIETERNNITDELNKNLTEYLIKFPLVSSFLKQYIIKKSGIWVKNALRAKYDCHEGEHYQILGNSADEKIVTPVDSLSSGITSQNLIWSDGLLQFVQLKHNLCLTTASLASNLISNIGYVKKYEEQIFGLTGALGSEDEKKLLTEIYNVKCGKLPTHQKKTFEESTGLIYDDNKWATHITLEIWNIIDKGRAVLVILKTENDRLTVENNLKAVVENINIRSYPIEENAEVSSGDVILAVNIAGLEPNFRLKTDLENDGGLHVCIGFLPSNRRVENKAFGLTSCQSHRTAQLIIRQKEVQDLGITEVNPDWRVVKSERDRSEGKRLTNTKTLIKKLKFRDEMFSLFSEFCLKNKSSDKKRTFLLEDAKEYFANWLKETDFKDAENKIADFNDTEKIKTTASIEFETCRAKVQKIIDEQDMWQNPFCYVALADYYLQNNERELAKKILTKVNETDSLPGVHLKLFDIALTSEENAARSFTKLAERIFSKKFPEVSKNIENAKNALKNAKEAISKEIEYIDQLELKDILIINANNLLVKQIYCRQFCLKIHLTNIDKLQESISANADINGRVHTSLENLEKISIHFKNKAIFLKSELADLHSVGLDTIYSINTMGTISKDSMVIYEAKIFVGIAALTVGLSFLPAYTAMATFGGSLISEATVNILMDLMSNDQFQFDNKTYIRAKFVNYSVGLITNDVSVLQQSINIMQRAVVYCRNLSSFIGGDNYIRDQTNTVSHELDKKRLEKNEQLIEDKSEKMNEEEEDYTSSVFFESIIRPEKFAKSLTLNTIVKEKVLSALQKKLKQSNSFVKNNFIDLMKSGDIKQKIQNTKLEDFYKTVQTSFQSENALEISKQIGRGLLKEMHQPLDEVLISTDGFVGVEKDLTDKIKAIADNIKQELKGGNANNNDVPNLIDSMGRKLADMVVDFARSAVYNFLKLQPRSEQIAVNELDKFFPQIKTEEEDTPYKDLFLESQVSRPEAIRQYKLLKIVFFGDPQALFKLQEIDDAAAKLKLIDI